MPNATSRSTIYSSIAKHRKYLLVQKDFVLHKGQGDGIRPTFNVAHTIPRLYMITEITITYLEVKSGKMIHDALVR